jgi:hypothetical protein
VVQIMIWVHRGKQIVEVWLAQLQSLPEQVGQLEQAYATAQAKVEHLTKALTEAQAQVVTVQAKVGQLEQQGVLAIDRLIVVLKLSGRCTVRSIVEVLASGLGVQVSVGYVQGIIAQAGIKAHRFGAIGAGDALVEAICG